MKKNSLIILAVLIVILGGAVYWYSPATRQNGSEQVFCTMEALLCPDGSGVGRQAPKCKFSACPNMASITGELQKDTNGYRLLLLSPVSGVPSITYTMPLITENASRYDELLNRRVTVRGTFTEGNTLKVEALTEASASEGGSNAQVGTLSVGETRLVSGVKITVNKIVSDSRCPVGVQCIQAGWVTANVTLQSDTDRETIDMNSNAAPRGFDSFSVSIASVAPEKAASHEINSSDYRLTFRVDALK